MLLLTIKLIGATSSTLFGVYGLGVTTRDDDGRLNRKGRIVLAGLVVSLVVTASTTLLEEHERGNAATAEVRRYERLMRGALSTRDARLDFRVIVAIEGLQTIAPRYAQRLARALEDLRGCRHTVKPFGVHASLVYDCGTYRVEDTGLGPRTATFRHSSKLFPIETVEGEAHALLALTAASLFLGEYTGPLHSGAELILAAQDYFSSMTFSVNEQDLVLELRDHPLDPVILERANFSSMEDLVSQKTVTLIPNLVPWTCPKSVRKSEEQCDDFKKILAEKVRWSRLAIKFPHRRDLTFDTDPGSAPRTRFKRIEKGKGEEYTRYVWNVPKSVDDLPISDRRHEPIR